MNILVIGESCKDEFWYGEAVRLAPEAPAPVFVPSYKRDNEGMAGNVAENLRSLGANVILWTNTNKITKTRYIDENTNHLLLRVDIGDNEVNPMYNTLLDMKNFDAVVISDYNKGLLTQSKIEQICEMHPLVFFDTKKLLGSYCEKASYIKINQHEYDKTKDLISEEIKNKLIITRGSKGADFLGVNYPVQKVEVKDLSGSGDSFLSGLVVEYLKSKDINSAIKFGNACATRVVQKRGVCNVI